MGGKEVKIGLSVILVLLIAFSVVLVKRLTRSADTSVAMAETTDSSPSRLVAPPMPKKHPPKPSGDFGARPTLVAANATSSKTPKLIAADASGWGTLSEEKKTNKAASPSKSSVPSYMPSPPKPTDDRYAQLVSLPAPPVSQEGQANAYGASGANQSADPFQHPRQNRQRSQSRYADQTTPNDSMPPLMATPPTPPEPPRRSEGNYRYAAMRETAETPAPSYRQNPAPSYGGMESVTRTAATSSNGYGSSREFSTSRGMDNYRNEGGPYEVLPNENYWTISEKLYGTGAYFKALAEHNRKKVRLEDQLSVGEVITAPSIAQLEKSYPDLCPKPSRRETVRNRAATVSTRMPSAGGRSYVVQEGDTLFNIARNELGKAARWSEIYEINRDLLGKDYHYLTPGMQLTLPGAEPTDSMTRRPSDIYQR